MPHFLGVDAGATKTDLVLGDETRELARVRTGTIKRMKAEEETAETNLQSALQRLTTATGVPMQSIARCCIGTAGETVPLVVDWLHSACSRLLGGELILVGDVEIALDAAFFGSRGVLVLAGTGSNIAGRTAQGTIVTAGGWGPAMADQGSGHFLGIEGLRRGFLAKDQQRHTNLLDVMQTYWHVSSIGELLEIANANPAPEFSRLAPLVVDCAKQGDAVAQEVLQKGGADLADLATLVIERMRSLENCSAESFSSDVRPFFELPCVAIAGSILEHVAPVRTALEARLREHYPGIVVRCAPADPPAGALWRARLGAIHPRQPDEQIIRPASS